MGNLPKLNIQLPKLKPVDLPKIDLPALPQLNPGGKGGGGDAANIAQSVISGISDIANSLNLPPQISGDLSKALDALPSVLDLVSMLTGLGGKNQKQ